MEKLISQGAEAVIVSKNGLLVKERLAKSYRYPALDAKLRIQRTRKEVKLLTKADSLIKVPKIKDFSMRAITMEKVKGKKLADALDTLKNKSGVCRQIGQSLAKLHDNSIIHGDLTTSNLIYDGKNVYFIDFGLGYESSHEEDKAIDLHVFKEALQARHPLCSNLCFKSFLEGYRSSKNYRRVLDRLEVVEKRGRYKQQY